MHTNYLQLAVNNNAIWCDTVCRSHNIPGEFHETFWMIRQQAPTYYPNLITLSAGENLDLHQDPLTAVLSQQKDYTISVKDSFADLNLNPFGFHPLFEAQWIILRSDSIAVPNQLSTELAWKRITEEKELLDWEAAWSQTELTQNHIFPTPLLHDANICIMAAYQDNRIVAGAIANKTSGVVGISNVFTPEQDAEQYSQSLLALISKHYPGLPIVGYEDDESLALAIRVGFTILGPLRVWLKGE